MGIQKSKFQQLVSTVNWYRAWNENKDLFRQALRLFVMPPRIQYSTLPHWSLRNAQKEHLGNLKNIDKQILLVNLVPKSEIQLDTTKFDSFNSRQKDEFLDEIEYWWRRSGKTAYVVPYDFIPEEVEGASVYVGHAALFMFVKKNGNIVFTYFNPHPSQPDNYDPRLLQDVMNEVRKLDPNFRYIPRDEETCPEFQSAAQGGNCVLWQFLGILFAMHFPERLEQVPQLYASLAQNPTFAILGFEMYMFYMLCKSEPTYIQNLVLEYDKMFNRQVKFPDINQFLDEISLRLDLEKTMDIKPCTGSHFPSCTETDQCAWMNGKCEFVDVKKKVLQLTFSELVPEFLSVMRVVMVRFGLVQDPVPPVVTLQYKLEPYPFRVFTPVQHYVVALLRDMFLMQLMLTFPEAHEFAFLYAPSVAECRDLTALFITLTQVLSLFSQCSSISTLCSIMRLPKKFTRLAFHCPTAQKLRWLLQGTFPQQPRSLPSTLYSTDITYNLPSSRHIEAFPTKTTFPVAAVHDINMSYRYVLWSQEPEPEPHSDPLYLQNAMWDGFRQQLSLITLEPRQPRQIQIKENQIVYFRSLPVVSNGTMTQPK